MLYRDVDTETQVLALGLAFAVGAPIGLGVYALLRPLRRRGRAGRFVAQVWAWWLALVAGLTAAVAVGGPYVVGSRPPPGGGVAPALPLTRPLVFWLSAAMALGYALCGLAAPRVVPRAGAGARAEAGRADV